VSSAFEPDLVLLTSPLPGTLWVELTSKCPYDCIFCSRRLLRGEGEHLPLELYRSLLAQLDEPDIIRLNYSGESIHYPSFIEALRLAKATGAHTELVSAFASIRPEVLRGLVEVPLDRLTVSLHTLDPEQFGRIYRHASLSLLRERVSELNRLKSELVSELPDIDIAFVAMRENLGQLEAVAAYAAGTGFSQLTVCPVIRRDPVEREFKEELKGNRLTPAFEAALQQAVAKARARGSGLPVSVEEYARDGDRAHAGARVRTCGQNPWETAHVLANGDLVPCEVQDRMPFGNLAHQPLQEIWHGEKYRAFRREYLKGSVPACADCAWKRTWSPGPARRSLTAEDSASPQFLRGWHAADGSGSLWSRREALVVLHKPPAGRTLRLQGILPGSGGGDDNRLEVDCDGSVAGAVVNPTSRPVAFNACFAVPAGGLAETLVRLRTSRVLRPGEGDGPRDSRRRGFALRRIEVL
jgi:MoaA/NifB/PqqE/SkfB family radical SAM enzyme